MSYCDTISIAMPYFYVLLSRDKPGHVWERVTQDMMFQFDDV